MFEFGLQDRRQRVALDDLGRQDLDGQWPRAQRVDETVEEEGVALPDRQRMHRLGIVAQQLLGGGPEAPARAPAGPCQGEKASGGKADEQPAVLVPAATMTPPPGT